MEEQGRRIESIMSKLVEDIDKTHIRKMQGTMYKCAAQCCEDDFSGIESVRNCVNKCTLPVEQAQKYVQGEFERAMKRLDRCFEDCRDKIQDKVGPKATEDSLNMHKREYENCASRCLEKHCDTLPSLEKSIKVVLSQGFSS